MGSGQGAKFSSPYGDKLQWCGRMERMVELSFRPLTEYKFTISHIDSKEKNHTPEKREWSRKDKP